MTGIKRPSAAHLTLPLPDPELEGHHLEQTPCTVLTARWTMAAGLSVTAMSVYSQESFALSPLALKDNRINRRRFAILISPSQEGPWSQVARSPQSSDTYVFTLDTTVRVDVASSPDKRDKADKQIVLRPAKIKSDIEPTPAVKGSTCGVDPKDSIGPKLKKSLPSAVFRSVAKKFALHRPSPLSAQVHSEEQSPRIFDTPPRTFDAPLCTFELPPRTSDIPPRLFIALPSPELKFSPSFHMMKDVPKRSTAPVQSKFCPARKPRRPSSPLPVALRKAPKPKNKASSTSYFVMHSPPPPLPPMPVPVKRAAPRPLPIPPTLLPRHTAVAIKRRTPPIPSVGRNPPPRMPLPPLPDTRTRPGPSALPGFSAPSRGLVRISAVDGVAWGEIQAQLRARALKSATYAIHSGGIISPVCF